MSICNTTVFFEARQTRNKVIVKVSIFQLKLKFMLLFRLFFFRQVMRNWQDRQGYEVRTDLNAAFLTCWPSLAAITTLDRTSIVIS